MERFIMNRILTGVIAVVAVLFAVHMFASEGKAAVNAQRAVKFVVSDRVVQQNRSRTRIAIINGQAVVVQDLNFGRDLRLERELRNQAILRNQDRINVIRLQNRLDFRNEVIFRNEIRRDVVRRSLIGGAILGGDVRGAVRLGIGLRLLGF
jgi:hypothetical protein